MNIRNYSDFENALKYWDRNGIYSLKLYIKPSSIELSSDEELDLVPEDEAVPNSVPEQKIEKSNLRNNQIFSNGFDEYALRQEEEDNQRLMVENSKINDNYFESFPSKASNNYDVLKPASFEVLNKTDKTAKPKQNKVMGWLNRTGNALGLSRETRDEIIEYSVVDNSIQELGNDDIILAMPGSVVKKTWRISNKQCKNFVSYL